MLIFETVRDERNRHLGSHALNITNTTFETNSKDFGGISKNINLQFNISKTVTDSEKQTQSFVKFQKCLKMSKRKFALISETVKRYSWVNLNGEFSLSANY